jgi:ABC-type nitrate/sulfonate/bicarbonate transport system substrate-binding protein
MELPLSGIAGRDETFRNNPKQVIAVVRAIFRAMSFASANREETTQIITNWLKVAPEIATRSYELGKSSWSSGGVVSDAAVRILVDQSMVELKTKNAVPLEQVRNWSFAEQARRELASAVTAR